MSTPSPIHTPPRPDTRKLTIKSAEEQVYEALRDEIIRGERTEGPLRLSELAEAFGVSTMPVRASLTRLESDGLVVQNPRRGAMVADLDIRDLEEIQAIRSGLEGYAARLGAEAVTEDDLVQMRELLGKLRTVRKKGDVDAYLAVERPYYLTAYRASGRTRLVRLVENYYRAAERYVRVASVADSGLTDTIQFQERFQAACEARDGRQAEAVLREALQWTADKLRPLLSTNDSA